MNVTESPHFLVWKDTLERAGNRLDGFEPLWVFEVGDSFPLAFAAKVDVHVGAEDRNKSNEFILTRPDICHTVVIRRDDDDLLNSDVVLVREFRSTSRTLDGFIRECPGGSGFKPMDPRENAAKELAEETGLMVKPDRLKPLGSKQVCGTFSTHKAHVYALAITDEEFEALDADTEARGVAHESERTYIETTKVGDILGSECDWANTGMILQAVFAL